MPSTPSEPPPLDERALEEAARAASCARRQTQRRGPVRITPTDKATARAAVTAYLGALPASEDVAEIIARLDRYRQALETILAPEFAERWKEEYPTQPPRGVAVTKMQAIARVALKGEKS